MSVFVDCESAGARPRWRGRAPASFGWASWRADSAAFRDGKDRVRDKAVRLAVDGDRGICIWSLDKAKDLAVLLVDPIPLVVDAVPTLCFQVGAVGSGGLVG